MAAGCLQMSILWHMNVAEMYEIRIWCAFAQWKGNKSGIKLNNNNNPLTQF